MQLTQYVPVLVAKRESSAGYAAVCTEPRGTARFAGEQIVAAMCTANVRQPAEVRRTIPCPAGAPRLAPLMAENRGALPEKKQADSDAG
jgi:hypothetical protein